MCFPTKGHKAPFRALDSISLSVQESEFVALIGHSGCGKSTLLNLIAGLMTPTGGSIICDGVVVHGPGPDRAIAISGLVDR